MNDSSRIERRVNAPSSDKWWTERELLLRDFQRGGCPKIADVAVFASVGKVSCGRDLPGRLIGPRPSAGVLKLPQGKSIAKLNRIGRQKRSQTILAVANANERATLKKRRSRTECLATYLGVILISLRSRADQSLNFRLYRILIIDSVLWIPAVTLSYWTFLTLNGT
jgi:hypothetical protein